MKCTELNYMSNRPLEGSAAAAVGVQLLRCTTETTNLAVIKMCPDLANTTRGDTGALNKQPAARQEAPTESSVANKELDRRCCYADLPVDSWHRS